MTAVLLFVEHELSEREVNGTLKDLAELRCDDEDCVDVTVLVPCAAHWAVALGDVVGAARELNRRPRPPLAQAAVGVASGRP